jgi:hypothetical protein
MKRMFLVTVLFICAGALFAQNSVIEIDATGKDLEEITGDMLLDWEIYNGKNISIKNVLVNHFSAASGKGILFGPGGTDITPWLRDPETFRISESNYSERTRANGFFFWFHPADRNGRKFMMDLDGKYYTAPRVVTFNGGFIRYHDGTTYNMFIVSSFIIDGTEYKGTFW